jgi:ornithine racemase
MAVLRINTAKLRDNINYLSGLCRKSGVDMLGVVKGCDAHPDICRLFVEAGVDNLGAAHLGQAGRLAQAGAANSWLMALPSPRQAPEVVRRYNVSFNSEASTLSALSLAAASARARHEVMLMVEVGDLREGAMPGQVVELVRHTLRLEHEHFAFKGLAAHFGCMSGLLPLPENTDRLFKAAGAVRAVLGREPQILSLGGSDFVRVLEQGDFPAGAGQARIGYTALLGRRPDEDAPHPDLHRDALILEGEVLEVRDKPSMPLGPTGLNAFGQRLSFVDRGVRKRAVLDFGALETEPGGLTPLLPGMEMVSYNSNYTVFDITACPISAQAGHRFTFLMNYKAMSLAFHSSQVEKILEQ